VTGGVHAWPESVYRDHCTVCGEEFKDCTDMDKHGDIEWEAEQARFIATSRAVSDEQHVSGIRVTPETLEGK
jgi:hypothetical protein